MKRWIEKIEATDSLWEMENLIEEISYDDEISNKEYEQLYEMALNKMRAQSSQNGEKI